MSFTASLAKLSSGVAFLLVLVLLPLHSVSIISTLQHSAKKQPIVGFDFEFLFCLKELMEAARHPDSLTLAATATSSSCCYSWH